MPALLAITIDGDGIELHALAQAVSNFADLLTSIGTELDPDSVLPSWEIAALSYASPARVLARARPTEGHIENRIAETCVAGMQALGERPERPEGFSDEALMKTKGLAELTGNGIRSIGVEDPANPGGASLVTLLTAENAAAVLAPARSAEGKAPGYENYGSVSGPAEAFNLHTVPFFTVWDMITGQPVRCFFGEDDREEIAGIVAMKRIVTAEGMLHRNNDGRLTSIRPVHSFRVIDDPPTGDLDSFFGLFGGIENTQEHLRRIRGG